MRDFILYESENRNGKLSRWPKISRRYGIQSGEGRGRNRLVKNSSYQIHDRLVISVREHPAESVGKEPIFIFNITNTRWYRSSRISLRSLTVTVRIRGCRNTESGFVRLVSFHLYTPTSFLSSNPHRTIYSTSSHSLFNLLYISLLLHLPSPAFLISSKNSTEAGTLTQSPTQLQNDFLSTNKQTYKETGYCSHTLSIHRSPKHPSKSIPSPKVPTLPAFLYKAHISFTNQGQ